MAHLIPEAAITRDFFTGLKEVIALHAGQRVEDAKRDPERYGDNGQKHFCVVHGDFRLENW